MAPTGFAAHIRSAHDGAGNLIEVATTHASSDAPANRLADLAYTYSVPNPNLCAGEVAGTPTNIRHAVTDLLTATTTTYCYDTMGRLTRAATPGVTVYSYGWDADTNRTTDAAGIHTFNAVDQLIDPNFSYDVDGNQVSSPANPALAYNSLDQTTSITPAAAMAPTEKAKAFAGYVRPVGGIA